jgi:hypothetical protein
VLEITRGEGRKEAKHGGNKSLSYNIREKIPVDLYLDL